MLASSTPRVPWPTPSAAVRRSSRAAPPTPTRCWWRLPRRWSVGRSTRCCARACTRSPARRSRCCIGWDRPGRRRPCGWRPRLRRPATCSARTSRSRLRTGGDAQAEFVEIQASIAALQNPLRADDRLTLARRAVALGLAVGDREMQAWGRLWSMDVHAATGRRVELLGELSALTVLAEQLGRAWQSRVLLVEASQALLDGRFDDVVRLAEEAATIGGPHSDAAFLQLPFRFEAARHQGAVRAAARSGAAAGRPPAVPRAHLVVRGVHECRSPRGGRRRVASARAPRHGGAAGGAGVLDGGRRGRGRLRLAGRRVPRGDAVRLAAALRAPARHRPRPRALPRSGWPGSGPPGAASRRPHRRQRASAIDARVRRGAPRPADQGVRARRARSRRADPLARPPRALRYGAWSWPGGSA